VIHLSSVVASSMQWCK